MTVYCTKRSCFNATIVNASILESTILEFTSSSFIARRLIIFALETSSSWSRRHRERIIVEAPDLVERDKAGYSSFKSFVDNEVVASVQRSITRMSKAKALRHGQLTLSAFPATRVPLPH